MSGWYHIISDDGGGCGGRSSICIIFELAFDSFTCPCHIFDVVELSRELWSEYISCARAYAREINGINWEYDIPPISI